MNESQYLIELLKPLVAFPDEVKVERTVDERGVLLTLDVNPQDMGRVIGRSGETARAVRRLLRQLGMMNNARLSMRITDPRAATPELSV